MIYAIAWIIPIVLFWIFLREAPMLFFIIAYTWYPLFAGVISCVVVSKQELGIWKWSVPPIVCVECVCFLCDICYYKCIIYE